VATPCILLDGIRERRAPAGTCGAAGQQFQ
jgi:hypothetical protein